jgi:hypothetical protein
MWAGKGSDYAIDDGDGNPLMDLKLEEAATILLSQGDRYRWEIRKHDGIYSLWTTRPSVFADTYGFAEEQQYWGLSERQVLEKLIGTTRGNLTLLPMTMMINKKDPADVDQG